MSNFKTVKFNEKINDFETILKEIQKNNFKILEKKGDKIFKIINLESFVCFDLYFNSFGIDINIRSDLEYKNTLDIILECIKNIQN